MDLTAQNAMMRAFLEGIAKTRLDDEGGPDEYGGLYEMSNDTAWEEIHGIVRAAREVLVAIDAKETEGLR